MTIPTLNSICLGDCVKLMSDWPDEFIDLTITSPPYDKLRTYNGYCFDFENVAKQLFRITKPGGVVMWNVNDAVEDGSETCTSFKQTIFFKEVAGFKLWDTMIWVKTNPLCFGEKQRRYVQAFEYMFVFVKGDKPKTFNAIKEACSTAGQKYTSVKKMGGKGGEPQREIIAPKFKKETKPISNIWLMGHASANYNHPAVFPEQMVEDHIITWTEEGELVFDPFMGSGTTAAMALKNARQYLGTEICQDYIENAEKRILDVGPNPIKRIVELEQKLKESVEQIKSKKKQSSQSDELVDQFFDLPS